MDPRTRITREDLEAAREWARGWNLHPAVMPVTTLKWIVNALATRELEHRDGVKRGREARKGRA